MVALTGLLGCFFGNDGAGGDSSGAGGIDLSLEGPCVSASASLSVSSSGNSDGSGAALTQVSSLISSAFFFVPFSVLHQPSGSVRSEFRLALLSTLSFCVLDSPPLFPSLLSLLLLLAFLLLSLSISLTLSLTLPTVWSLPGLIGSSLLTMFLIRDSVVFGNAALDKDALPPMPSFLLAEFPYRTTVLCSAAHLNATTHDSASSAVDTAQRYSRD
mmetsp:Transcript_1384/g.2960  ORF Transcript_1384/g.2960 Transcript_1384/m.2960 type:complete len:215 (-) Transcript_1384:159-803(-)